MRPVPPACEYIQVNGCKTPGCVNFGVPPREGIIFKSPASVSDGYAITGVGSANLLCKHCHKFTRLKSNRGILSERRRQGSYLSVKTPLCCPDPTCANHTPQRSSNRRLFYRKGKTAAGSDRFQCIVCKKNFVIGRPAVGQRKSHLNLLTFKLLLNKVPINRMCEILELGAPSVYGKIDFIERQCRLFAASRESRLPSMDFERMYLCTDRQDYMVNWGSRSSRRTIQLTAVATADLKSGYLFGYSPNFDATMQPDELEKAVALAGDDTKPYAMREYAHFWTESDYRNSVFRAATGSASTAREDLVASEMMSIGQQLPSSGVQVHAEYLMHGHYWFLRYPFCGARKIRFFLDQDLGLLSACMGAFADRIGDRTADVVIVDIDKDLSSGKRAAVFQRAKLAFADQRLRFPGASDAEVKMKLMAESIARARAADSSPHALQKVWLDYPYPDLAEPSKRFRYVTDYADYDDEHTANLLNMGSLWPVDTTFNQIRRRFPYFERPIRSNRGGEWAVADLRAL